MTIYIVSLEVCSGIETVIFNYDTFPWKKIIKYHFLILQRKLTQYWGHTNEYLNQKIIITSLKNDITTIIFLAHRGEQQNDWSEHLIEQFFFKRSIFFFIKTMWVSQSVAREKRLYRCCRNQVLKLFIYIYVYIYFYIFVNNTPSFI